MALSSRRWLGLCATLSALLIILSVLVVVLALRGGSRTPIVVSSGGNTSYGIITQGAGSVTRQPDIVFVSVGVEANEPTASLAQSNLASSANQLIAVAKTDGVGESDINLAGYSIGPTYAPPNYTQVTGYRASEQLNLKWHQVNTVGKLLDDLVQKGGAGQVNVSFGLADATLKAAQAEARSSAVVDARERAQTMASAAGVKVGSVLRLSDLGVSGGVSPNLAIRAGSSTQLPVGPLEVSVNVEVDFNIA